MLSVVNLYFWGVFPILSQWLLVSLQVLITLVMLVGCLNLGRPEPQFDTLGFFAGAARIARASRLAGECGAAFDISYHAKPEVFDLNSPSGLVLL